LLRVCKGVYTPGLGLLHVRSSKKHFRAELSELSAIGGGGTMVFFFAGPNGSQQSGPFPNGELADNRQPGYPCALRKDGEKENSSAFPPSLFRFLFSPPFGNPKAFSNNRPTNKRRRVIPHFGACPVHGKPGWQTSAGQTPFVSWGFFVGNTAQIGRTTWVIPRRNIEKFRFGHFARISGEGRAQFKGMIRWGRNLWPA